MKAADVTAASGFLLAVMLLLLTPRYTLLDVLGYGVELLVQRRKVEISRKLTDFGEFCKHEQRVIRDTCGLIHFVAIWVYI